MGDHEKSKDSGVEDLLCAAQPNKKKDQAVKVSDGDLTGSSNPTS